MAKVDSITMTLQCTKCKNRTYTYRRNKKKKAKKLDLKKHCKFCRKHTLHKLVK